MGVMRIIQMQHTVTKLVFTSLLLAACGSASAQSDAASQFGSVGGMHAGNAQACGATPAQVDKLRASHKAKAIVVAGTVAGFDKSYDAAEAKTEAKVVSGWKSGKYKPTPEVCKALMQQVGA